MSSKSVIVHASYVQHVALSIRVGVSLFSLMLDVPTGLLGPPETARGKSRSLRVGHSLPERVRRVFLLLHRSLTLRGSTRAFPVVILNCSAGRLSGSPALLKSTETDRNRVTHTEDGFFTSQQYMHYSSCLIIIMTALDLKITSTGIECVLYFILKTCGTQ